MCHKNDGTPVIFRQCVLDTNLLQKRMQVRVDEPLSTNAHLVPRLGIGESISASVDVASSTTRATVPDTLARAKVSLAQVDRLDDFCCCCCRVVLRLRLCVQDGRSRRKRPLKV